jgi:hypothetical protein
MDGQAIATWGGVAAMLFIFLIELYFSKRRESKEEGKQGGVLEAQIKGLEVNMSAGFSEVKTEIAGLRSKLSSDVSDIYERMECNRKEEAAERHRIEDRLNHHMNGSHAKDHGLVR